jgi:hypothetical protein
MIQEMKELKASLGRCWTLAENAHPKDDSWRKAMAAEFALWQVYYERAQKRVPPPYFAEGNAKYVHALGLFADAGKKTARGIDDGNQHEIDAGTKEIKAADAEFKVASHLLFGAQYR